MRATRTSLLRCSGRRIDTPLAPQQIQATGNDNGRAERPAAEEFFTCVEPGQDQRERACCQHHSGGHAEQAVFNFLRNLAQEQRRQCAKRRCRETGAAAKQRVPQPGRRLADGQINQRLSPIAMSAAGLARLGIQPAGKERAAVLYLESDVARICSVLIRHLTTVARGEIKEAV